MPLIELGRCANSVIFADTGLYGPLIVNKEKERCCNAP